MSGLPVISVRKWSIAFAISIMLTTPSCSSTNEGPDSDQLSQEVGDWIHPACLASSLGPPGDDPNQCNGPWTYSYQESWVNRDACGDTNTCLTHNACISWDLYAEHDGLGYTPVTWFETGPWLFYEFQEPGGVQGFDPGVECPAEAATRLNDLLATRPDISSPARNGFTVTSEAVDVNYSESGCGQFDEYCYRTWTYRCGLHVNNFPTPMTGVHDWCSCAAYQPGECPRGGVTTAYTAPGEHYPDTPGAPSPGSSKRDFVKQPWCMTYDTLPTTTPAEVQEKFDKLWSVYQGPIPTTLTEATFKQAISTRLKLMYELWGEQLVNQHSDTDQIHHAIGLYSTHPDDNPSCMSDVDAPPPPTGCTAPEVTTKRGELIRCQRLVGQHASEGVASLAVDACASLLSGYLDIAEQPAQDSACAAEHLREVGAKALFQLEDKQLGVLNTAPTSLGALPRQLWLLDRWYDVAKRADDLGTFPAADQQQRDTSYLLGRLWSVLRQRSNVEGELRKLTGVSTTDEAEEALNLTAARGREVEQNVVTAMFTVPDAIQPENITLTRPPLRGLPLIALLGDALKPTVDDLNGIALYHDMGCSFKQDCRAPVTNTPSRNAWNILSKLEASPGLHDAVAANPHALAGWKPVFAVLANGQGTLTAAIADAVTGTGGLAGATNESDVHPLARPLWVLYQHARSFHSHYEAAGMFEPSAQNVLHGSVLQQDQQGVVNGLRTRVNDLQTDVNTYRNGLVATVRAQIELLDNGAQVTDLTDRRIRKAVEMNQKAHNLEGLRASGEDEEKAFASVTATFATIQRALNTGAYVQVGDTETFTLTGQDAHFAGSSVPAEIAAHSMLNLTAGKMIAIHAADLWVPTCSLRDATFLKPDGGSSIGADLTQAEIGPEGYMVAWNQTAFKLHSSGHSASAEVTVGQSVKFCTGVTPLKAIGLDAQACVYADAHVSGSTTLDKVDEGSENRSSASFATGLRLSNTPFPQAPVGSLLVVLTDPASGTIRDVKVVHSDTTVLVTAPSHAYFVVNDKQCGAADASRALTVSTRLMSKAGDEAEAALGSMADVLADMRARQQALVEQGTMLPTDATLLRQQAYLNLQAHLDQLDVASLPAPLLSLFDAFVSHEIVATERRIEMRTIERSLELDMLDVRMIDDELRAGATRARLQSLVPQWIVRDLDHDALRTKLVDVLEVSRDNLRPIIELWYPHALDDVALGQELDKLLDADVGTSLVTLADSGDRFVKALLNAYERTSFGYKPPAQQLPLVVVTFPRPGFDVTGSPWRAADPTRAKRVWDAINARTVAHFEITADDFYSSIGGDAVLSCHEVVPVIKSMGFYVVRHGASDNESLNGLNRTFAGAAGADQSFVTTEGPRVYQFADALWQHFLVPVIYGETTAALTNFLATPRQTRPVGLSPTGAFDIDFSVLDTLANSGFQPSNEFQPSEVALVLELDSRAIGPQPTWVDRCR